MKRYKLIVSDFDGTLRASDGGVSAGNAAAIRKFIDMIGYEAGYAEKCCLELFLASFDIAPDLVASKLSSDVIDSLHAMATSADPALSALAEQIISSTHSFTQPEPPA